MSHARQSEEMEAWISGYDGITYTDRERNAQEKGFYFDLTHLQAIPRGPRKTVQILICINLNINFSPNACV